jgi:hypothetical protein
VPYEEFIKLLYDSYQKISLLPRTLVLDPETWRAISAWGQSSSVPDNATYDTPEIYLYYAMRYILLISIKMRSAMKQDEPDWHVSLEIYGDIYTLITTAILVLMREDVQSMLSEWDIQQDHDLS